MTTQAVHIFEFKPQEFDLHECNSRALIFIKLFQHMHSTHRKHRYIGINKIFPSFSFGNKNKKREERDKGEKAMAFRRGYPVCFFLSFFFKIFF